MAIKITDNVFEFGNQKYFRGNAHLIQMGTYGEKKDPIGARSYVDPQSKVQSEILAGRVKPGTIATIEWGETTQASFSINGPIKYFGLNGKVGVDGTYEKAKTAHLKLANFYINEGPLTDMLNKDADGARKFLADEGDDARIVGEVWVAMEAELAEHFATYGSVSASAKAAGSDVQVTVSGGKNGSQSVSLSPGTTFAYKLYKVKKWTSHDKTRIENLEADYKGIG